MPSKRSTKKFWKCPEGCPKPSRKNPEPCPHLEALLPGIRDADTDVAPRHYMEKLSTMPKHVDDLIRRIYSTLDIEITTDSSREEFIRALKKFGVNEPGIDLLTDKFVEDKSLAGIARDRGYTHRWAPKRHLKALKSELKAKGFGLKKKQGSSV